MIDQAQEDRWRQQALADEAAATDVLREALPHLVLVDAGGFGTTAAVVLEDSPRWVEHEARPGSFCPGSPAESVRQQLVHSLMRHRDRVDAALKVLGTLDDGEA